jgi:hypothetical protein
VLGLTPLGLADWGVVLGGATLPALVTEMNRRRRIDGAPITSGQGGRDGHE